tara:strand:- start:8670 stop:9923 length:1254 start_codon:yes stop_codon:yes gene_type:complete
MRSLIVTLLVLLLMWTGCTYVACHAPLSVGSPPPKPDPVTCGIDTLTESRFDVLRDRRVGLITNHTGLDGAGRRTVDVMAESDVFELVALFSPEHGFGGELDEEGIVSGLDAATGLPVHSLYGTTRRPTPQMLEGLDTLVFDIQDVGVRFYTYISTMGIAMEAAAEAGVAFIVLDRPNPLGGVRVAGPVLDDGLRSFVAFHELPVQHGMTVGELARMFRVERELDLDLRVVEMQGWERAEIWTDTGLTWIPPSPNLPTFQSVLLYPGLGLIETTNVSVGRGTPTPFELVGAPWMNPQSVLAAFLASAPNDLKGQLMIEKATFRPTSREFVGEACRGVRIRAKWGQNVEPLRMAAHLIHAIHVTHPEEWDVEAMQRLLGDVATLEAVRNGASAESLLEMWRVESEAFDERRQPYLLYR